MAELLPMVEKDGKLVKDPEVNTILFHDKDPETLSFNDAAQEDLRSMPPETGRGIQKDRHGAQREAKPVYDVDRQEKRSP